MRGYRIVFLQVQTNLSRQFNQANQIDFYNAGTTTVLLNNSRPIEPGTGLSFQAFPGEVDVTNYDITFPSADPDNLLIISIKEYC